MHHCERHPAICDVESDGAKPLDLDVCVAVVDERRLTDETHAEHLAIGAIASHTDEPGWCFENEIRHGHGHRHDAGLEENSRHAPRVRT